MSVTHVLRCEHHNAHANKHARPHCINSTYTNQRLAGRHRSAFASKCAVRHELERDHRKSGPRHFKSPVVHTHTLSHDKAASCKAQQHWKAGMRR
jgi:hypothetical protein